MSYVDAMFDRDSDFIKVVERINGKRVFKEYPVRHTFYYEDTRGKYKSIYDTPVTKVVCKTTKDFRKELSINNNKKLFEADLNPVFVCLSSQYQHQDPPSLNVAWLDIEVRFDPERGYASPDDAFMPITAVAVHLQWLDTLICLAVPPPTLTMDEAVLLVEEFPNTHLFNTEAELLDAFLDLIKDADVLSGWNSEGFDIPYLVNRVTKALSKNDTRRFCLWNQFPKRREYEKYGKEAVTYDLVGRVHLDSLELYRKYTYEERHSYRLDAIAEYELGDRKTAYEGTLDQLYNNDFKKFIEYNRQDTMLLEKLDKKLKFLDLANAIAHENTVLLQTTMGAVAVTEQAIINEAHDRGFVVPNRNRQDTNDGMAAGAYVAHPKEGIHDWIGSLDINSLYPSVIRALNMGPETIVGQLSPAMSNSFLKGQLAKGKSITAAWEGRFGSLEYDAVMNREVDTYITIEWEEGGSDTISAANIYKLIYESNQPWMLSANGTIFTHEREGIIPGLLKRWYSERKEMQKKLKEAITSGDKEQEEYWDKRQLVKKINLNSLYGAILNQGCRFFDKRIGQSTTLTGRQIAKHMAAEVNKIITGEYNHVGKSIIYGDSVTGDSMIISNQGRITIEELFNRCNNNYTSGSKEYGNNDDITVMGFTNSPEMCNIHYVMRHYTTKDLYEITLENDKQITVTQDHSIMVIRNNSMIELKPTDISESDLFICLSNDMKEVELVQYKQIVCKGSITDYVYDISINGDNHMFFANECLVHNTDSCSADTIIRSNWGDLTIEQLFNAGQMFSNEQTEHGVKEYSSHMDLQVVSYDDSTNQSYYGNVNYIYRHKVSKERWEIEDELGHKIVVTGDHSIMVERNGKLIEIKPRDILDTDILICLN